MPVSRSLTALQVHFYKVDDRSPWWLRLLWWPRPRYAHVSVEWSGLIHDVPARGTSGLYNAQEFKEDDPPDLSIPFDVTLDADEVVTHLIDRFIGTRVDRWGCVKWYFGWRFGPRPMSCVTLVCAWLNLGTDKRWAASTASELYRGVVDAAAAEHRAANSTPPGE